MDMCAFPKRSELYCGLFNDCLLTVCFSLFLCFLVRLRCRRKKFTFAISSADEFLVSVNNSYSRRLVARERTTFYDDIATNTIPLNHLQYCSLHLRRVGPHLPRRRCSLPPLAGDVCLWRCAERGVAGRLCSSFNKGWPRQALDLGLPSAPAAR